MHGVATARLQQSSGCNPVLGDSRLDVARSHSNNCHGILQAQDDGIPGVRAASMGEARMNSPWNRVSKHDVNSIGIWADTKSQSVDLNGWVWSVVLLCRYLLAPTHHRYYSQHRYWRASPMPLSTKTVK